MIEVKFSKAMLKRNNAVGVTHGTDYVTKRDIVKQFMNDKKTYKNQLFHNMDRLIKGNINKETFLKLQKQNIKTHFNNAFLLGKQFNQKTELNLNDKEKRFITYQTTQEMNYMTSFAEDILNKQGKMSYRRRMKMYADGLDPMFKLGDIAYLPENIMIRWILGLTDKHCIDCLMFAKNSPYTKKELPGIPKSGNTRCLSNCRCRLIYYTDNTNTEYTNFIVDNYTDSRSVIPTENDFQYINHLKNEFFNNRLKYELTGNGAFMDIAKEHRSNLTSYISVKNLAVVMPIYVAKQLIELKKFKNHKNFITIDSFLDIKTGDYVSVHKDGEQMYGFVTSVDVDNIIIDSLFEKDINVSLSKHIVFKEI